MTGASCRCFTTQTPCPSLGLGPRHPAIDVELQRLMPTVEESSRMCVSHRAGPCGREIDAQSRRETHLLGSEATISAQKQPARGTDDSAGTRISKTRMPALRALALLVPDALVDVGAHIIDGVVVLLGCDLLDELGGGVQSAVAHALGLLALECLADLVLVLVQKVLALIHQVFDD